MPKAKDKTLRAETARKRRHTLFAKNASRTLLAVLDSSRPMIRRQIEEITNHPAHLVEQHVLKLQKLGFLRIEEPYIIAETYMMLTVRMSHSRLAKKYLPWED